MLPTNRAATPTCLFNVGKNTSLDYLDILFNRQRTMRFKLTYR